MTHRELGVRDLPNTSQYSEPMRTRSATSSRDASLVKAISTPAYHRGVPDEVDLASNDPFITAMLFLGALMAGAGGVVFWLIVALHL